MEIVPVFDGITFKFFKATNGFHFHVLHDPEDFSLKILEPLVGAAFQIFDSMTDVPFQFLCVGRFLVS